MIAAIVCEKMGWTLQQYEDQPVFFIDTLLLKWVEETKHAKDQEKG